MQVVGIDLGTTNLRISTWDTDQPDLAPQPLTIGQGNSYTMPTVIAFLCQPGGEIETRVGEAADNLADGPNQVVVRNVKRYALAHDPYVRSHLEVREIEWPSWWNQEARCVQVWGQDFPVKDLISLMLKEAFQRAGLTLGFEWRAGCPVHAGYTYRSELAQAITELGGNGRGEVSKVIEEPLLLLALAASKFGTVENGSYLVYDLGGGSFDCALAQIEDGTASMIIFGADGNPVIGGSDIDAILAEHLEYDGPLNLLRLAKEQVSSTATPQPLPGGKTLTQELCTAAVITGRFVPKTFTAMRDAYTSAKMVWKRNWDDVPIADIEAALAQIEETPNRESDILKDFAWLLERQELPAGEIYQKNPDTNEVKFVWQLDWDDMSQDLKGIILCGGPTKLQDFPKSLKARFGKDKIIPTPEAIPSIPDPELTAISAGGCYASTGKYLPVYVNRLPVRITLEDLQTGEKVHYEPYQHLTSNLGQLYESFVSKESLSEQPDDPHSNERYELTVTTPDSDGILLPTTDPDGEVTERQPVGKKYRDEVENPSINTRLMGSKLSLVVNRLGQVGVEQESAASEAKRYVVITNQPWQTDEQSNAIRQMLLLDRFYRKLERARSSENLTRNPWRWQEHPG